MPGQHVAIRTRTEWASEAGSVKILDQDGTGPNVSLLHATQPEQRYTEEDQTDPAGRWRTIITGDVYTIQRAATADWATFTTIVQFDSSGWLVPDDVILGIGTSRDTAIINRSTVNAADAEITNVIVGTSDHQGTAANSLVISNITASGDIQLLVNNGGNSLEALLVDASVPSWHLGYGLTGDGSVYVGTGNSFDVYINKVKQIDYATGALAFQQATTISTTTGDLTLSPVASLAVTGVSLTVNQAGSESAIFQLINTDVVHGRTTFAPTNVFLNLLKLDADAGGLAFRALAENAAVTRTLAILASGGAPETVQASTNVGLIDVYAEMHDGANTVANITANGNVYSLRARIGGANPALQIVDANGHLHERGYFVAGIGERSTTALTGTGLRAPDVITGGAGNVAGADLTIAAGLGTGTGDVGTVIFSLPVVAAAGDNIQTRAARLTLDMVGGSSLYVQSEGTGAAGMILKNMKNAAASALSGTQLDVEIDIGGTPYYFTVYPTKA